MSPDQLILIIFFCLIVATLVLVARKGIASKQKLCWGVFALVSLSVIAIALHCFISPEGSSFELRKPTLSFGDMGMGVLFLALASIGLLCASPSD
jgi:hypothetical protein